MSLSYYEKESKSCWSFLLGFLFLFFFEHYFLASSYAFSMHLLTFPSPILHPSVHLTSSITIP